MSVHNSKIIIAIAAILATGFMYGCSKIETEAEATQQEVAENTSMQESMMPQMTQGSFGFGQSVDAAEIARYDGDIHTDGTGLPEGSGNLALGREIFEIQCAICHGENLEGVREMGAQTMHEGRRDIKKLPYATSMFDFIRRAMPLTDPGTLSNDETYGLVAFLLVETGVIDDPELTLDAESLAAIKMPNRANFIIDPASRFTAEDLEDK
jgi:mono/diheme cytochrome c family protein